MPQTIAVLTGDVIGSRRLADPAELFRVLDACLAELAERFDGQAERYRGDGFQLALPRAAQALTAAVMLRAALIMHSAEGERWDARLAVATGQDAWHPDQPVSEASGPVFIRSGQALDELGKGQAHLCLALPRGRDGGSLALLTRFVDDLIDGWSRYSAEAIYWSLRHDESQQALAARLGISQPSVHKRLRAARWELLDDYLRHVQGRLTDEEPTP